MAANLSSGNFQNYDLGHGIRIMQGVKPDVVLLQEFTYKSSSAADLQEMTDAVLGAEGFFYREPSGAGFIPNGILSRYPILEAGIWDDPKSTNREFAWARIDVPGDRDLWAVSVHLLTKDAATRDAEAKELIFSLATKIPPGDLVTLGGDINSDVNTEPCFTTFAQQLVVQPPFPADQEGNENTSANRKKPYDWVLADPDLNALAIPVHVGAQVFPAGLVIDTRVYQPIEDLAPALVEDSAATNMQHMGVIRDFLLPVP
jgi:endonuclease/exonuclease/phosphatase family metal-dependent hydrolase